ncbi:ABC transporter ATP-binding protein [Actinomadura livida]|uniref:ABC transporter ATP-binding protein n=1 Tax=Actinomadura livida TaxID=79909 RepID=A0A7W7MYM8_9ACTN|nr:MULTISPECIES: ABC transporter ATP-binding protein [Actinomadura]MBB4775943.1 branched-chain amino acid transport system ATP-binding protein [Actinomadura catellatispora]GGU16605.1 ABC transporter ATP-binding protein [Actinomadura livida]
MSILELSRLRSGYGDLEVVTDVSFRAEPGRVTALLGRNGAGKTTTLRAVTGLNRVMSGSVTLDGEDISKVAPHRRARMGIAYVQEGKRIFRSRTVEENLTLGSFARPRRRRGNAVRDELYDRFPMLAERRRFRAAQLSGGQQQMLAIAQALAAEPGVLLLDEPSAGLAPTIVGDVLEVIKDLREQGLAIVLVEQAVEFALAAADGVVVLNVGRTVYEGTVDQPGLRDAIKHAYMADGSPSEEPVA